MNRKIKYIATTDDGNCIVEMSVDALHGLMMTADTSAGDWENHANYSERAARTAEQEKRFDKADQYTEQAQIFHDRAEECKDLSNKLSLVIIFRRGR